MTEPFYRDDWLSIFEGDCRAVLRSMPEASVHAVVTSPPYYGLRDYGVPPSVWGELSDTHEHEWGALEPPRAGGPGNKPGEYSTSSLTNPERQNNMPRPTNAGRFCGCGAWLGQLGLEPSPWLYVEHLVEVFREVRRVLHPEGTVWLNLGDSYAADRGGSEMPAETAAGGVGGKGDLSAYRGRARAAVGPSPHRNSKAFGLKHKDLIGIPWRVAFALQDDGWWLRRDIVWCLSPGTVLYVRTAAGSVGPMTVHDLVRLDPADVMLWNGERWTRVLGWSSRHDDDAIRLTLRSGERIAATRGHQWPTTDGRLLRTEDIRVGDVLARTTLPEPTDAVSIDRDLAWFAGLYMAEGSRSDDAIQIAGHTREQARHDRVAAIAKRYGGSCVARFDGNKASLVVHGAFLDAAVRHFVAGRTAKDKHLHSRVWRSSNDTLTAFMEGYLAGDGAFDGVNDRWRLGFTNNPQLVTSFRTLAARLGATLTISPMLAKMGDRRFEAYRGEWRWHATDHHNTKDRAEVVAIEHAWPGEFVDIGVADEPHLFALASGVLTHNSKPNPMPESVEDRPTSSHEFVFMLTRSERYFYDRLAVLEASVSDHGSGNGFRRDARLTYANADGTARGSDEPWAMTAGRNRRSVWTISTRPYPGAHYAVFPPELVETPIRASTSEKGACPECGAQWRRLAAADEDEDVGWRPGCGHGWGGNPDDLDIIASPLRGSVERPPQPQDHMPEAGRRDAGTRGNRTPNVGMYRRGLARERGDDEGRRFVTRYEQRMYADQMRRWPKETKDAALDDIARWLGKDAELELWKTASPAMDGAPHPGLEAFRHYHRTDPRGARAIPNALFDTWWIERGWLTFVDPPDYSSALRPVRPVVMDIFGGSGTVGLVAQQLGRRGVLIDVNGEYLKQQLERASRQFGVGGPPQVDDGTAVHPEGSLWRTA